MNCRNCNNPTTSSAKFCSHTHCRINNECSACGVELSASAKFCSECGTQTTPANVPNFSRQADFMDDLPDDGFSMRERNEENAAEQQHIPHFAPGEAIGKYTLHEVIDQGSGTTFVYTAPLHNQE